MRLAVARLAIAVASRAGQQSPCNPHLLRQPAIPALASRMRFLLSKAREHIRVREPGQRRYPAVRSPQRQPKTRIREHQNRSASCAPSVGVTSAASVQLGACVLSSWREHQNRSVPYL